MALRLMVLAAALQLAAPVLAESPTTSPSLRWDGAHPAVARIIVTLSDGMAFGSGTLVGADETHGLVVTNWHVVREAAGAIMVVFPDGFRSGARVLKTDRDWDLAALAIWRPSGIEPVPISPYPIPPGEPLTIAGYGPGWYRASTGRCMQYFAPATNFPAEIVELSTPARQGDSGGPIFNNRGEVAGVLFGTAEGRTMGSYGGRVRAFLESAVIDFRRLSPGPTMIAQQNPQQPVDPPFVATARPAVAAIPTSGPTSTAVASPPVDPTPQPTVTRPLRPSPSAVAEAPRVVTRPVSEPVQQMPIEPDRTATLPSSQPAPESDEAAETADSPMSITWAKMAGPTRADQAKTVLAVVGVVAILFHSMHFFGSGQKPVKKKRRTGT
jgi:hypothetical protein